MLLLLRIRENQERREKQAEKRDETAIILCGREPRVQGGSYRVRLT